MFGRTKKEIVLNAYTCSNATYECAPICEAKKLAPRWVKELPSKERNIKKCPGINDYYKKGFFLPLWSDLFISIGPKDDFYWRYQYSDLLSKVVSHPTSQWGNNPQLKDQLHLKIESPWIVECDDPVEFYVSQPMWGFKELQPLVVFPGVCNFKHQNSLNVNTYTKIIDTKQEVMLEYGTPLMHIVPLTTSKVVIKNHLITQQEHEAKRNVGGLKFNGSYYGARKFLGKLLG